MLYRLSYATNAIIPILKAKLLSHRGDRTHDHKIRVLRSTVWAKGILHDVVSIKEFLQDNFMHKLGTTFGASGLVVWFVSVREVAGSIPPVPSVCRQGGRVVKLPAKQLCIARVGSNPILVVFFSFLILCLLILFIQINQSTIVNFCLHSPLFKSELWSLLLNCDSKCGGLSTHSSSRYCNTRAMCDWEHSKPEAPQSLAWKSSLIVWRCNAPRIRD